MAAFVRTCRSDPSGLALQINKQLFIPCTLFLIHRFAGGGLSRHPAIMGRA